MTATATFEYQVRDRTGKLIKGKIDAESSAIVANKLQSMGFAPVSINETGTGLKRDINIPGMGDKMKLKDLAVMCRQFATMINSGLTLLRALSILEQQTESKVLAKTLTEVRGDVESGSSLSSALAKHPRIFPPLMTNMTRAGEIGGFLDETLLQIAANFESEVKLRQKVKSAMTYPVVVGIMAVLALTAMLLFIVPVFEGLFSQLGGELPMPTQFLVTLSGVLKMTFPFLIVGGIATIVLWRKYKDHPKVRDVMDPMKLRMPVFGGLFQKIALSRFARNLASMTSAGVPILQALDIVAETSGNVVVARAVHDVEDSVRQGEPLARPLLNHPVFPPMVVQMMAVGEDTGSLDTMLYKISEFYDQEVEATTEALTSLIEPLMIAVVGALIGGMLIALYLPMFKIFELIQ